MERRLSFKKKRRKKKKEVAVLNITAMFSDKEENYVKLFIEDNFGIAVKKKVRLAHFKSVFDLSCHSKSDMIPIGELPKGYYDGLLTAEDETSFVITICVTSGMRYLCYYDERFYIPFPTLMFKFGVKKGRVIVSEVFSLDTNRPCRTSKLYRYPFGNVYDNGNICWGLNILKPVLCKKDLDDFVALFFSSGTNDDLFKSNAYDTQRALFMYLKGEKTFPKELLMENKKYANVEAMLNET